MCINKTVNEINLADNDISAVGCKALADCLKGEYSLKQLNICINSIGSSLF